MSKIFVLIPIILLSLIKSFIIQLFVCQNDFHILPIRLEMRASISHFLLFEVIFLNILFLRCIFEPFGAIASYKFKKHHKMHEVCLYQTT